MFQMCTTKNSKQRPTLKIFILPLLWKESQKPAAMSIEAHKPISSPKQSLLGHLLLNDIPIFQEE